MKLKEKNEIINWAKGKTDAQLEEAYYDAVHDCLGSQAERMAELGYEEIDIREREAFETYLCEKADVLEMLCQERGIELWKEEAKK